MLIRHFGGRGCDFDVHCLADRRGWCGPLSLNTSISSPFSPLFLSVVCNRNAPSTLGLVRTVNARASTRPEVLSRTAAH